MHQEMSSDTTRTHTACDRRPAMNAPSNASEALRDNRNDNCPICIRFCFICAHVGDAVCIGNVQAKSKYSTIVQQTTEQRRISPIINICLHFHDLLFGHSALLCVFSVFVVVFVDGIANSISEQLVWGRCKIAIFASSFFFLLSSYKYFYLFVRLVATIQQRRSNTSFDTQK